MPKVVCPNCDSVAANVSLTYGRKYYCARCGWNVNIARKELRSSVVGALGVTAVGVILAIIARMRNPGEWGLSVALIVAFLGLPGLWAARAWWRLRNLGMILPPASAERAPEPSVQTAILSQKGYPALAVLARPRKLRMTWRGRLYLGFAIAAVGFWTYFLPAVWRSYGGTRGTDEWVTVAWSAMIYGYSFSCFRNRYRERQLLANGELATGYVIKQTNTRYSQTVDYTFQDAGGNITTGHSTDASRSLYEGMSTPVFYETFDPKRNISLDCSLTKIDMR